MGKEKKESKAEGEVYAILHIGRKEWRINMRRKGPEDPFRTGSIGYSGQDNIAVHGEMHLCSVNVVQFGTKGKYGRRPQR